nr:MAG TPA: hypothetical protein [Caudoviricetes sp.]
MRHLLFIKRKKGQCNLHYPMIIYLLLIFYVILPMH